MGSRRNQTVQRSGRPAAELTAKPNRANKLPSAKPAFVEPMKALLVEQLPKGAEWEYEVKFDGFRALAIKQGQKVSLISRNAKDLSARYLPVMEGLKSLPAKQFVIDGEIVALDTEGRSSFQQLQSYQTAGRAKPPLLYYAFDLLNLEGKAVGQLPLKARKELLQGLLRHAPETIRFSASIAAESSRLQKEMKKRGLEGLVAKRKTSSYEAGQRTGSWVKFKWSHEQEFVIGGYTPPKGARSHIGAILVGYNEDGKLLFASKVGSGFDTKMLASLHRCFAKFQSQQCPFANLPERLPSGLSAAEMRTCTWLKPELVCQIRFTEWTRDHHLRHPLFLGMREDKSAHEVVREQPV